MFGNKRTSKFGFWNLTTSVLAATVVILALAASLMPALSRGVTAAECPPGQKLNSLGVCIQVVLDPNVDVLDVDVEPQTVPDIGEHLDDFDVDQSGDGAVFDPSDDVINGNTGGEIGEVVIPVEDPIWHLVEYGSASVSITARICPEGFDAYNVDSYELALGCVAIANPWNAGVSTGTGWIGPKPVDANGNVEFSGLTAEPYMVGGSVYPGFGEPVVMCESYTPQHPNGEAFKATIDANFGDRFVHTFVDDEQLSCSWYSVPSV